MNAPFPQVPQDDRLMTELPDPIEWPELRGHRSSLQPRIIAAMLLGLLSAGLIGWATGLWITILIYGGLILGAVAVAIAWSPGARRRAGEPVSMTLLRGCINASSEALAVTDAQGVLVCANTAYGKLLGGFPSPMDLSDSVEDLLGAMAEARAGEVGRAAVQPPAALGARARHLRLLCRMANDPTGHLIWSVRASAEERLLDQARTMAGGPIGKMLTDSQVMSLLVDMDGGIVDANDAFWAGCNKLVAGRADPGAVRLMDCLGVDDSDQIHLRRDGQPDLPVRVVEIPLQLRPEAPAHAAIFLLLEERPAPPPAVLDDPDSGKVLSAVLQAMPLPLVALDQNGRMVEHNLAFAEAVGPRALQELLYPSDLVAEEDKAAVANLVRRVAASGDAGGPAQDINVQLSTRQEDAVRITVFPSPAPGGTRALMALWDNPEQRKLERQIAQATKMQAVGQLAGGVAHDFNNILTAIIGYCDLMLLRHGPGDMDFQDINQIRQNANRAANLVRQLLAFSRQQTLRPQILRVTDVLAELSNMLKRLLGESVSFSLVHGRNIGAVRADKGQLEQVIVNLAVNARDAMKDGGELKISTRSVLPEEVAARDRQGILPPGRYVAIDVSDTGHGIAKEHLSKIFDPFFTTKEVGKGTGLGLSTVYGIVKQTGGYIFADSVVGEGTVFTVYLPEHDVTGEADDSLPAEAPAGAQQADAAVPELWGNSRVLLVEDEAMVRAVTTRALQRKGYTVIEASNGAEAMELIAEMDDDALDLLITDVVMPEMDGPSLVRKVRQRWPEMKVIMMSGYAEEELRKSIDLPDIAFLAKPFSVQDLASVVRTVVG